MRHSVAVYQVNVTEFGNPSSYRQLGDIDNEGTKITDVVQPLFGKIEDHLPDESDLSIALDCELPDLTAMQAGAVLLRGEKGVRSDIDLDDGTIARHRHNVESVRVACLLSVASGAHTTGHLAIYVPSTRGIASAARTALAKEFRKKHSELVLRIDAMVPKSILQKAVDQNGIREVEYIAFRHPADKFPDATDWLPATSLGKVKTTVSPTKGTRIKPDRLGNWLNNDGEVSELLVFQNTTYDEIHVKVVVDGRYHTINLGDPDAGRTAIVDVTAPDEDDDENPTPAGLKACLVEGMEAVLGAA